MIDSSIVLLQLLLSNQCLSINDEIDEDESLCVCIKLSVAIVEFW